MGFLEGFLIFGPPLIIAVVFHEVAHGWAADKLGDPTARKLGRLTLNPIKHIDPVMTLLVPGLLIASGSPVVFGGAKPVPINPYNLKNPRKAVVLIAAAGPAINFVLAALFATVFMIFKEIIAANPASLSTLSLTTIITLWAFHSVLINIILALFNLFPIPPLDGGRIAVGLLPEGLAMKLARLEPYGFFILVAAIYMGVFESYLMPAINIVQKYLLG